MIEGMGSEAFQVIGDVASAGPFVFTCEHACNAIPEAVEVSPSDRELLRDHWGWDIGARDLTHELVVLLGGQAVVSTFSRLWVDPNRSAESESLIPSKIDGQPVHLNDNVDHGAPGAERARRIAEYYEPYHQAIERVGLARAQRSEPYQILSIHSFTPLYLGKARPMEIGVLFNEHDERAWHMEEALISQGFETALNAPYSGKPPERLIYSAQRHGQALDVPYLELEIRQDLIDGKENAQAVGKRIAAALETYLELSVARQ